MSCLLVLSGLRGYGETIPQAWIDLSANTMYAIVIIACILILVKELPKSRKLWVILFSLPIDILILSLILPLVGIKMHPIILFLFDVYVLLIFSFYLGHHFKYSKDEDLVGDLKIPHED